MVSMLTITAGMLLHLEGRIAIIVSVSMIVVGMLLITVSMLLMMVGRVVDAAGTITISVIMFMIMVSMIICSVHDPDFGKRLITVVGMLMHAAGTISMFGDHAHDDEQYHNHGGHDPNYGTRAHSCDGHGHGYGGHDHYVGGHAHDYGVHDHHRGRRVPIQSELAQCNCGHARKSGELNHTCGGPVPDTVSMLMLAMGVLINTVGAIAILTMCVVMASLFITVVGMLQ